MHPSTRYRHLPALWLSLLVAPAWIHASTITTPPNPKSTTTTTNFSSCDATCEFRTINYITASLPQQCLTSAWKEANDGAAVVKTAGTVRESESNLSTTLSVVGNENAEISNRVVTSTAARTIPDSVESQAGDRNESAKEVGIENESRTAAGEAAATATDLETEELNEASFLSFEEWKKQTLEKAGQANANIGSGRKDHKRRDIESSQNNLDSLGDDAEIDLDFGAFSSGKKDRENDDKGDEKKGNEGQGREIKKKDQYRSKDAGKTCKERFSYASFDAGATILKTHPGAKNSKAVLIENKDSYMLSECSSENKFLIVELSEDIWIDTLVLANYEFFSSMIRSFRVSVSDRYPVKMEKWKDLGIYEARNSREIQAFLIENPQIWARYIRVEFISHYGNEYYCPLSLVRVHGTRMLESWKETEAIGDDDEADEADENEREDSVEEQFVHDAVADVVREEERSSLELKAAQDAINEVMKIAQKLSDDAADLDVNSSQFHDANTSVGNAHGEQTSTPWYPFSDFRYWLNISHGLESCVPKDKPSPLPVSVSSHTSIETTTLFTGPCEESIPESTSSTRNSTISSTTSSAVQSNAPASTAQTSVEGVPPNVSNITSSKASPESPNSSVTQVSSPAKLQSVTGTAKNKTSTATTSSSTALPTQQESFFKAVSRRLQLLETNSTLSLKYIEEQSKILREAFAKVEKRQFQKTTTFLDTLNSTVLSELREVRQQYDQIWQSTVISLESQREESRREILAITSRLNILADEVVFQKRMSIIQSVLLLLCLGLVIFSRVSSSAGPFDFHNRSRFMSNFQIESPMGQSPPYSPEYQRVNPLPNGERWVNGHRRFQSDVSAESLEAERSLDGSPPTPVSNYSNEGSGFTPPSGGDSRPHTGISPAFDSPKFSSSSPDFPNGLSYSIDRAESTNHLPLPEFSPVRTPKKRKAFTRQQGSPLPDSESVRSSNQQTAISQPPITITQSSPPQSPPYQDGNPNPSPSQRRQSFGIARKPLPSLPPN